MALLDPLLLERQRRCYTSRAIAYLDAGRPELKRCLDYLREGDTVFVTKIDRLARSISDLYRIISRLERPQTSFPEAGYLTVPTSPG